MRIIGLLIGFAVLAVVAVGCGSSDDSTESTASITKAEFVKQGNAICAAGNKEIEAGFNSFAKENKLAENKEPTEAQFEEVAETVLIPAVEKQIEGVRALGAPSGEEDQVNAFLDNAEATLEEVEEDPNLLAGEDSEPFEEVNKEAHALGLTVCGEE